MKYNVLLYYRFSPIEFPETHCEEHKKFSKELGLKGRIYVSSEGLNGTVSGTFEQTEAYKKYVRGFVGFEDTEFKENESDYIPFAKLTCKMREEIVALHVPGLNPEEGGKHLQPEEWRRVIESGEDYVMIDVRNDYESKIGYFKGAIKPQVENFYDFPDWLKSSGIPKEKKSTDVLYRGNPL